MALTVALAIGMRRMAARNVIVRRLIAVEALGSCTYIATDKTGTLTVNQLTVRHVQFPGEPAWEITGEGLTTTGTWRLPEEANLTEHSELIARIGQVAVLANEASLWRNDDEWTGSGDAVDLALLIFAHKIGITQAKTREQFPETETIPYESAARFSASLNQYPDGIYASVKGAVETVLPMCTHMATLQGDVPLVLNEIRIQAETLAASGYRVLALASGRPPPAVEALCGNRP
ncbi:MAG: cation-transporting P-type ATPase, partial [Fluviibacter sp.]